MVEAGLCLTHHPQQKVDHVNLCGHVHPGVRLQGKGDNAKSTLFFLSPQPINSPCLWSFYRFAYHATFH